MLGAVSWAMVAAWPALALPRSAGVLRLEAWALLGQAEEQGWRGVVQEDFAAAGLSAEVWETVPTGSAGVSFDDRGKDKAAHVRADGHDVGFRTRARVAPPFRLGFDFLQPSEEAGGYRLVAAHWTVEGQSFWFEFDRTSLAVWTISEGTWEARWTTDGFRTDTWYRAEIENEAERVRVRVAGEDGKLLAESPWLAHDLVTAGAVGFIAGSGGGLRGCLYDNIVLSVPEGATVQRKASGVDRALHRDMASAPPARSGGLFPVTTRDGLQVTMDRSGVIRGLQVGGTDVVLSAPSGCGGWWAWDVAGEPKYHRFVEKPGGAGRTLSLQCEELGLELEVRVEPGADQVDLAGELRDLRGEDRAVVLVWALPVAVEGWSWGDDLNASRTIDEPGRYEKVVPYLLPGRHGRHVVSIYPWACVSAQEVGLLLSRPLDQPRLVGFFCDYTPERSFLGARIELGLSPATEKFRQRASFRLALSALPEPAWGFRAAARRYYELYPEAFARRVEREGVWHLWVSTQVPGPEDFAMVFHEQEPYSEDRVAFDEAHGGYSLTYAEPNTLWQQTRAWGENNRLDAAAFLHEVEKRATQPLSELTKYPFGTQPEGVPDAEIAQAVLRSYLGRPGDPSCYAAPPERVAVNCNGDPELGKPSRASLWFDYEGVPALTDERVDGAYLDSVGWNAFDNAENVRREHWATADLPLVPSFRTGGPVQLGGFAHYELYEAIARAMRERGKLVIANSFPYAHGFYAHLLDVLGAGEASSLDAFHDVERLGFCRALAFRKPVSHMNYAYLKPEVSLAEKERAMQRTLVYAVWPGTGDGGKLEPLEAVRALYRKYVPLFRAVTTAGWEPIPYARAVPEGLVVERYGRPEEGTVYFVMHNPGEGTVAARLVIGAEVPVSWRLKDLRDLVSGQKLRVRDGSVALGLAPYQTAVIEVPMVHTTPEEDLRHEMGL